MKDHSNILTKLDKFSEKGQKKYLESEKQKKESKLLCC